MPTPLVNFVIRYPSGEGRRVVPLEEVVIPDLWRIAMILDKHGYKTSSEAILETWHLAHNLLDTLKGKWCAAAANPTDR